MIDGILLDLSGVLYVGDVPIPGAAAALRRLHDTGLPLRYVTNTTRSPRRVILHQLAHMGFDIGEQELFTAPDAARAYLDTHGLSPYLLVHPALKPEFADLAAATPDAVLVGDAGDDFTYAHLNRAFRILMAGGPLIAMGRSRYFQEADGLSLDAGPFIAALENAAGVQAVVTGKPAAAFFHAATASLGCEPAHTVMVGDDVEADVNGALDAGLQGILVQTGKYRPGDEARLKGRAAAVLPDLAAAAARLVGQAGA